MQNKKQKLEAFERLLEIMDKLRVECPWDRKQTFESLRNLTIEETYELADAIDKKDMVEIKEELGDLMLHMVFYSKIGEETGDFDVSDVLDSVSDKLIKRHPHIYGDVKVEDENEVKKNWEQLKLQEVGRTVLGGVPSSLPGLIKAYRMQDKTAQVGFEWDNKEDVWEKVEEEIAELKECIENNDTHARLEDEFGDVLFALVNYGRFINVEAESAISRTNDKFKKRFDYIEAHAPKSLADMTLSEMDKLWNEAKTKV